MRSVSGNGQERGSVSEDATGAKTSGNRVPRRTWDARSLPPPYKPFAADIVALARAPRSETRAEECREEKRRTRRDGARGREGKRNAFAFIITQKITRTSFVWSPSHPSGMAILRILPQKGTIFLSHAVFFHSFRISRTRHSPRAVALAAPAAPEAASSHRHTSSAAAVHTSQRLSSTISAPGAPGRAFRRPAPVRPQRASTIAGSCPGFSTGVAPSPRRSRRNQNSPGMGIARRTPAANVAGWSKYQRTICSKLTPAGMDCARPSWHMRAYRSWYALIAATPP